MCGVRRDALGVWCGGGTGLGVWCEEGRVRCVVWRRDGLGVWCGGGTG